MQYLVAMFSLLVSIYINSECLYSFIGIQLFYIFHPCGGVVGNLFVLYLFRDFFGGCCLDGSKYRRAGEMKAVLKFQQEAPSKEAKIFASSLHQIDRLCLKQVGPCNMSCARK